MTVGLTVELFCSIYRSQASYAKGWQTHNSSPKILDPSVILTWFDLPGSIYAANNTGGGQLPISGNHLFYYYQRRKKILFFKTVKHLLLHYKVANALLLEYFQRYAWSRARKFWYLKLWNYMFVVCSGVSYQHLWNHFHSNTWVNFSVFFTIISHMHFSKLGGPDHLDTHVQNLTVNGVKRPLLQSDSANTLFQINIFELIL